jgi:3-hydroxymyristoyl/3-hydroxydecanoyl-(acyl carrier protein) dehydratase
LLSHPETFCEFIIFDEFAESQKPFERLRVRGLTYRFNVRDELWDNDVKREREETIPGLPCQAVALVPQRPPMLIVGRLLERDRQANFSLLEAVVPENGVFVERDGGVLPEYFIELVAQAMAAVNGYDGLVDGEEAGRGFLVGIDNFRWQGSAGSGERLKIEIEKDYEFGPVSVMAGKVFNRAGEMVAAGEIKAWEEK